MPAVASSPQPVRSGVLGGAYLSSPTSAPGLAKPTLESSTRYMASPPRFMNPAPKPVTPPVLPPVTLPTLPAPVPAPMNPLVSVASFHSTTSSRAPGGVTYTGTPSYVSSPSYVMQPQNARALSQTTVMSNISGTLSPKVMVGGHPVMNGSRHWFIEMMERIWPSTSRYLCKQLLSNFDEGDTSQAKLEKMVKDMSQRPPPLPIKADFINFMLQQVWEVVQPSVSKAVKEMLKPKLHSALSMVAPVDINPCLLGDTAPQMDEIELLEDQGLGNLMDLKLHFFWHSEPDITVECKLGSVALPKLKLGFTMYLGLQGESEEPPFFNAAMLYMGNGFMHARDVLNTKQEKEDPYIGMTFGDAWTGFSTSFVEDAVVGALNGVIVPKLVLPSRMLLHVGHGMVAHDLMMPKPHGCLQITVKGVNGLVGTEWKLQSILTGARSNDPYVTVDLGGSANSLRTPTCYNELNPTWDDGNTYYFVIDSVRLQHFNLRVYDDGLLQMFREQQIGMASQEDLMARKLGLSVMDLFGMSSLDFYDKEQEKNFTCSLDTIWEGREDHAELRNAKPPSITLGLHWRPIVYGQPSMLPQAIFLDDDEPEPVWPHFVLRVCFGKLEMRHFTMKPTDLFSIHGTVMPGFDSTGSHHEDPKEGVSAVVSKKVYAQHQQNEDRTEMVSRMTGGRMGRACKVATFDQGFRFWVRDPRNTKIHLTFNSVSDFDKTDTHQLGELTLEVNSLLKEKDLSLDIKNEDLDNWEGGDLPARFSGHLQLYQLHDSAVKQAGAMTKSQASQLRKEQAQREAQALVQKASALRAEAEALERQAKAKDSDRTKKQKGRNTLKVRVTSARGLRAADFTITRWGTSDPYCSVELAGKAKSGFKTQVLEKTLEPYWDYEGTINNYTSGMALKFNVYDKDFSLKDDLLGSVTLSASQFHPNGFEGELPLHDEHAEKGQESFIQVEVADVHGEFPSDAKDTSGLKVKIISARGFMDDSMSLFGRTVSCLFSTCEIAGKARSSMRTQAIAHSSQPEWNYERQMRGFKEGESLVFKVLQDNNGKDQPLMSKVLKCEEFYPHGFAGELDLVPEGKGLKIDPDMKPVLEVLISDSEGKYPKMMLSDGKLEVRILAARNLPASDVYLLAQASSDPYVRCEVANKPQSGRFRTKTVDKSLFPVWNHQHRMRGYEKGDNLVFTIYDEDQFTADDVLGHAMLKSSQFHDTGFLGELRLEDCDEESYLKVQVSSFEGVFHDGVQEEKEAVVVLSKLQMLRNGLGMICSFICGSKKK